MTRRGGLGSRREAIPPPPRPRPRRRPGRDPPDRSGRACPGRADRQAEAGHRQRVPVLLVVAGDDASDDERCLPGYERDVLDDALPGAPRHVDRGRGVLPGDAIPGLHGVQQRRRGL